MIWERYVYFGATGDGVGGVRSGGVSNGELFDVNAPGLRLNLRLCHIDTRYNSSVSFESGSNIRIKRSTVRPV